MFAAVRERLVGAWRRLREGSLVKLFVFEFVVVLLGVLAAQWVADWAQDRRERAETEEFVARLDEQNRRILMSALIWQKALPRLRTRVETVMRKAASGDAIGPELAERPRFFFADPEKIDPAEWARLRRHAGQETTMTYQAFAERHDVFREDLLAVSNQWETFARLDPRLGAPSDADRAAVRQAGGDILSRFRGLSNDVSAFIGTGANLNIEAAAPPDENGKIRRPLANCDEISVTNSAFGLEEPR